MLIIGVIGLFLIFLFIVAPIIYGISESRAQSRSTTFCYMMEISMFLNEQYEINGSYPEGKDLVNVLGDKISSLGCGVPPDVVEGLIVDTFDDVICYNRESNNQLVIFSKNVHYIDYDRATSDYNGFELVAGSITPKAVEYETKCGPS